MYLEAGKWQQQIILQWSLFKVTQRHYDNLLLL